MPAIPSPICLFFAIVFGTVYADYMVINWNISTDRDNSRIEREFNYPIYHDVAPAPCDLTDSCDAFCLQDTDCDEFQKKSFITSESATQCNDPLSVFDCNCDKFEKPEWFSLLCFVSKNPVYLGKFYEAPRKIEKLGKLKSLIIQMRPHLFNTQQNNGIMVKRKAPNQYGSPVMTFVPMSETFPSVSPLLTKMPMKDSSYACISKPVTYWFNSSAVCLTKVNRELCENGYVLSVLPYLVQGSNQSTNSNIPIVLNDLSILKGLKTEINIRCVELNSKTKRFKKVDVSYFEQENVKSCGDLIDSFETVFLNSICQNVLVYVQYEFILNGSDIVKLKVEYGLADVPVDDDKYSDVISKYIYLKQKFRVTFFDASAKSNGNQNFSRNDDLLNRGYFFGEELNFGYKRSENSSVTWEKGLLGVFNNGNSCDNFSPITFGFDYFSVCHIGKKFPNCSQLRTGIEEKFEALLKGDSLAAYSNLRPPYNSSAPLLRSYLNASQGNPENFTGCLVPLVQDICIQYTSMFTEGGARIHRVLGVRVDRTLAEVGVDEDVALTSRVLYFFMSSAKVKSRSRFWEKMFSPEQSENALLYFFNAFDDVTPSEREEITFWCIFLFLLLSAVAACVKLDFNFGEFTPSKAKLLSKSSLLFSLFFVSRCPAASISLTSVVFIIAYLVVNLENFLSFHKLKNFRPIGRKFLRNQRFSFNFFWSCRISFFLGGLGCLLGIGRAFEV